MSTQRLQKILAQSGVASRRAAEQLILDGRVRVNGRIVRELGSRANLLHDRVEVNGRRLVAERPVYYLLHKPRSVVTTLDDPEGRPTVKDYLRDVSERVFPVGRLDFHTSGVLLLTNDGALAQALLHPRRAVPKTYNAKLQGQLDQAKLDALRAGVVLDDGDKTAPAEVCLVRSDGKHTALEITIAEGKNRQIHRMGEAIGHPVLRLTRVSFAGLTLERLQVGQKRPLTGKELGELKQQYLHGDARPRAGGPRFSRDSQAREFQEQEFEPGDVDAHGPQVRDFDDVEPAHPTRPTHARGAERGVRTRDAGRARSDATTRGRTQRVERAFPQRDARAKGPVRTQRGTGGGWRDRDANTRTSDNTRMGQRRSAGSTQTRDETRIGQRRSAGSTQTRDETRTGQRRGAGSTQTRDETRTGQRRGAGSTQTRDETRIGQRRGAASTQTRDSTDTAQRRSVGSSRTTTNANTGRGQRRNVGSTQTSDDTTAPARHRNAGSRDQRSAFQKQPQRGPRKRTR